MSDLAREAARAVGNPGRHRLGFRPFGRAHVTFFATLVCCAACTTLPHCPIESQLPVHSAAVVPRSDGALELATVACDAEPTLRSTSGDAPVLIRFLNLRAEPVELIWLDYDGKRKSYGLLDAGAARDQRTYLSHPWIVANASGICIDIRIPRAAGYQATIH
jgi:VHL beta domain